MSCSSRMTKLSPCFARGNTLSTLPISTSYSTSFPRHLLSEPQRPGCPSVYPSLIPMGLCTPLSVISAKTWAWCSSARIETALTR
jgi:hypothetical protein